MEEHKQAFNVFLAMHSKKGKVTKEPIAYLVKKEDCVNPNAPLVAWKEEHLVNFFDHDSVYFQVLMKQFKTYDYEKQILMGMIVDKQTILSEVLEKK